MDGRNSRTGGGRRKKFFAMVFSTQEYSWSEFTTQSDKLQKSFNPSFKIMSKQLKWWDQINFHSDLRRVVFPHYIFLQINTWLWRHFWSAGGLQSAGLRSAATVIIVNANSSTKSLWMIHWYSSNILKSNLSSIYSSFSFISFSSVNGVDCEM